MESSYSRYGTWARLQSQLFSPTDHGEFSFEYYMNGASVNLLRLYIVVNGYKSNLLTLTDNQGDEWHSVHVPFSSLYPFRVRSYVLLSKDCFQTKECHVALALEFFFLLFMLPSQKQRCSRNSFCDITFKLEIS